MSPRKDRVSRKESRMFKEKPEKIVVVVRTRLSKKVKKQSRTKQKKKRKEKHGATKRFSMGWWLLRFTAKNFAFFTTDCYFVSCAVNRNL